MKNIKILSLILLIILSTALLASCSQQQVTTEVTSSQEIEETSTPQPTATLTPEPRIPEEIVMFSNGIFKYYSNGDYDSLGEVHGIVYGNMEVDNLKVLDSQRYTDIKNGEQINVFLYQSKDGSNKVYLYNDNRSSSNNIADVFNGENIIEVDLFSGHVIGLTEDGRVLSYRTNLRNVDYDIFENIDLAKYNDITQISASTKFISLLNTDGTVSVEGIDYDTSGLNGIKQISSNPFSIACLKEDGSVVFVGEEKAINFYSKKFEENDIKLNSIGCDGYYTYYGITNNSTLYIDGFTPDGSRFCYDTDELTDIIDAQTVGSCIVTMDKQGHIRFINNNNYHLYNKEFITNIDDILNFDELPYTVYIKDESKMTGEILESIPIPESTITALNKEKNNPPIEGAKLFHGDNNNYVKLNDDGSLTVGFAATSTNSSIGGGITTSNTTYTPNSKEEVNIDYIDEKIVDYIGLPPVRYSEYSSFNNGYIAAVMEAGNLLLIDSESYKYNHEINYVKFNNAFDMTNFKELIFDRGTVYALNNDGTITRNYDFDLIETLRNSGNGLYSFLNPNETWEFEGDVEFIN